MSYVYIIQSHKTGRYYVGATRDLQRRIKEHNAGKSSTKRDAPFELVYAEEHVSMKAAVRREAMIKSYKSGNAFKKLLAKDDK